MADEEKIEEEESADLTVAELQTALKDLEKKQAGELDGLKKSLKDTQAWGTKASQEAAELRGRFDQMQTQQAQPQAGLFENLRSEELQEQLREDPSAILGVMENTMGAVLAKVVEAMEYQDQVNTGRFQNFSSKLTEYDPRRVSHEDQIKKQIESDTIPGFKDMTVDQQVAIVDAMPKEEGADEQPAPSRMNPPGSAGAGTGSRTPPREIPMGEDPAYDSIWKAMGVGDDDANGTLKPSYTRSTGETVDAS